MALFEPIFSALNDAGVRYVVVGGMAVILQGYVRVTADVDLVVDLEPGAARRAVEALTRLGLRARVPEDPLGFADPQRRRRWIAEKGLKVFNLYDPGNPLLSVDLFVEPPLPFEAMWRRADPIDLGSVAVRAACIEDLIAMKRSAGRNQDLSDIEALEEIRKDRERHG